MSADPQGATPHEDFGIEPTLGSGLPPISAKIEGNSILEQLFDLAMRGELPRHRQLKSWEPDTLAPQHLNFILAKSAGVPQGTIASFYGYEESTVSIVLNHPDSRYILARLAASKADSVLDMQKRLEALVPVAIDQLTDILLDGKEDNKVKIAFGILDRKGYGIKQESKVTHEFSLPAKQAAQLTEALREGRHINDLEYVNFVEVQPGGSSDGSDGGQDIQSGVDMPPVNSPQAQPQAGEAA